MPDTILKRWNGSTFEELYPKTTVGQISASGTLSSSTFLRGDGQWQIPATQSHTHGNITNAGAIGSTSGLGIVTTTSGVLTTRSISDSTTLTILDSASTNLVTERDVYSGTHYIFIDVSAAIANSTTFTTMTITSGMRDFLLHIHQDSTTGAVVANMSFTTASSESMGTATPGKTHRVEWSNGSAAQRMNIEVFLSGTTLSFRHSFTGASLAFRWFGR